MEHVARALEQALQEGIADGVGSALRRLVAAGLDQLPMPGSGGTLQRWRALAQVAACDLSLVKLYEGHTDALAILSELNAVSPSAGSTWGTWAAEVPGSRTWIERDARSGDSNRVLLVGRKAWCSGARVLSHGLLTAWLPSGEGPFLVSVAMSQDRVKVGDVGGPGGWNAVGMAASESVAIDFDGAVGSLVGGSGDYLSRPGFWHGGGGIAACWFGGATAIAEALRASAGRGGSHRLAALGAVDVAMAQAAALLREAAQWIDDHPRENAQTWAMRARAAAEAAATEVLKIAGRALGATPYCRDPHFARMAADLPVYLRQSHGDSDLEALGQALADANPPAGASMSEASWRL